MEFNLEKDRTNIVLIKKALSQCSIIAEHGKEQEHEETKIRHFLCPCGLVSTFESEEHKLFKIRSVSCNL